MSIGVFMPPPAPLLSGGGGTVLEGEITVAEFDVASYGWSDGMFYPPGGSISGDAAPYFIATFMWDPPGMAGIAVLEGDLSGASLTFMGETYAFSYNAGLDFSIASFGPEVSTWPTSGTHPFTLTLP